MQKLAKKVCKTIRIFKLQTIHEVEFLSKDLHSMYVTQKKMRSIVFLKEN